MRVERIKAKTMHEAMDKIKKKLGEDAVILNTRSDRDGIEVIAARDADEQPKTGNTWLDEVIKKDKEVRAANNPEPLIPQVVEDMASYTRSGQSENNKMADVQDPIIPKNSIKEKIAGLEKLEEATKTAKEFSDLLSDQIQSSQEQHKIWIEHEKQLDVLKKQVIDLKESILRQELIELKKQAQKLQELKNEKKQNVNRPVGPDPALLAFYAQIREKLMDRGVAQDTAEKLVSKVEKHFNHNPLDVKSKVDVQLLKDMLVDGLSEVIPVLPQGTTKILSLIGPRNSGKTTSCLKIALKESLVYGKKVALVLYSTEPKDSMKHLEQLSSSTKLPLAVISTPEELSKIMQVHSDKDLVIVDFAITDTSELKEIYNFIPPSTVLLTLPATLTNEQFSAIQKSYESITYHALLLTHIDRLIKIGMVVEIVKLFKKPLSYISKGIQIPEDIEYANKTKLSHMILRG